LTRWPALPYAEWKDTRDTLHMQLQVIGKVRLALSPFEPQWANVPLYLTGRGVTTSTIPHPSGDVFDIDVDFVDHHVAVRTGAGRVERVQLQAPVAAFYAEMMDALARAEVPVEISTLPSEVPDPIRFPDDTVHATYDGEAVTRFWRALLGIEAVLREFRARFRGKTPPVELWWGSLDLTASLYSGRPVETPPDADVIMRLGGDAEYFCAGFWPGDHRLPQPAFFAYMYPKPDGVEQAPWWHDVLGEFVLPYDDVRESADPRSKLLEFVDGAFDVCWTPAAQASAERTASRQPA
jgi:Family of unknown function (DUF5996)